MVTLNFTTDVPAYSVKTKADEVTDMALLTFDANGKFIAKVVPTTFTAGATGTGTARVDKNTAIIHFVANYDGWGSFAATVGEAESAVLSVMTTSHFTYWGRVATDLQSTIAVHLLRNFAKVTVENAADSGFSYDGLTVCNYTTKGTVATCGESTDENGFANVEDRITATTAGAITQVGSSNATTNAIYTFEYANPQDKQMFAIIHDANKGYFKVQLIDANKNAYVIERNYIYVIRIKKINSDAQGASSVADAMNAAPSNNIYAEVLKESASVVDDENNVLTVDQLSYLFTGLSSSATATIKAHYYPNGSSTEDNSQMVWKVISDPDGILSNTDNFSEGTFTPTVKPVTSGAKTATVMVSDGNLSRYITIVSAEKFKFDVYSLVRNGDQVTITFNIPESFPVGLYPIKCYITTGNLNPSGANKNLLIEYATDGNFSDASYKYVYNIAAKTNSDGSLSTNAGKQTLTFTVAKDVAENVKIENPYFVTATMRLKASTDKDYDFKNVSVTSPNYESGSTFTLKFDSQVAGEVVISGDGFTSQTVNAIAGSNSVTLTTTDDGAEGTITLTSTNINPATINYTNTNKLGAAKTSTGDIFYGNYNWLTKGSIVDVSGAGSSFITLSVTAYGEYTVLIAKGADLSQKVTLKYISAKGKTYTSTPSLMELYVETNVSLQRN